MVYCSKCDHKFSLKEKFKAAKKSCNEIKCENCNTIFRKVPSFASLPDLLLQIIAIIVSLYIICPIFLEGVNNAITFWGLFFVITCNIYWGIKMLLFSFVRFEEVITKSELKEL